MTLSRQSRKFALYWPVTAFVIMLISMRHRIESALSSVLHEKQDVLAILVLAHQLRFVLSTCGLETEFRSQVK